MNLFILVPRVIQGYISKFPEVRNNAYKYFNYDNRVVEERVPRGDVASTYKGPDDFTDVDYDGLVKYAKTIVNPILLKYSPKVAQEDALNIAIRSYANGQFDGKVNAGHFSVLLQAMSPELGCSCINAAKKKKKEEETTVISPGMMKSLKMDPKSVPSKERARIHLRKGPSVYREKGRIVLKRKAGEDGAPNEYLVDFLNIINEIPTRDLEVIRRLVGRWKLSKTLVKDFLQDAIKDAGIDPEYAQKIAEDFKTAAAAMDKLESLYDTISDFSMEKIKTHMEPLQDLVKKIQDKNQAPVPEETPEMPEPIENPIPEDSVK